MKKRKTNQVANTDASDSRDRCQTPAWALEPILRYLPRDGIIWESAAGEGLLAEGLARLGFEVFATELLWGQNFFEHEAPEYDVQVTNPPYSTKYAWLRRSYELGQPFALLMPVDVFGSVTAQRLFDANGIEIILIDKRINYKMPNLGFSGSGAHFASAWFTWGLGVGRALSFWRSDPEAVA